MRTSHLDRALKLYRHASTDYHTPQSQPIIRQHTNQSILDQIEQTLHAPHPTVTERNGQIMLDIQ